VQSPDATHIQTGYFSAKANDLIHVTVDCNFAEYACLAGVPVLMADGKVVAYCYEHPYEHSYGAGAQEQVYSCRVPQSGRILVNAPGEVLFAQYDMLVQDDSSI
jgi:hypothetical protein